MTRSQAVDAAFLSALVIVALAGLTTTFTGIQVVIVGAVGVVVGIAIVHLTRVLGWPGVAAVVLGLAAFLLLGGPLCLRDSGPSAFLPGPGTLGALSDQVLFGWKDLLTTLPPVDGAGPLLVLPWALGLAAGLLGAGLARWDRPVAAGLPLIGPASVLVLVILLGVRRPQSLWLQGVVFAILALGWLVVRTRRHTAPVTGGVGARSRVLMATALVLIAGVVALPITSWLTGPDDQRVVLRTYVTPPFDVGQYPSPLASFRRYVETPNPDPTVNRYDSILMTVQGAPAGSRIRIAALDYYDGIVWGAANDTIPGSSTDSFQRVSSVIDNPVDGESAQIEVTVGEGYDDVWLPTIGALQSMDFEQGDPEAKGESFRYNLATETAVVPSGVRPGDVYRFETVVTPDEVKATDAPSGLTTDAAFAASFLETQRREWSGGENEPMARVFAVANYLRTQGRYSDGVIEAERAYRAGHNVRRLGEEFANAPIMAGNDEQYAAIMALMANSLGVPARVVMGAEVPADGVVQGQDIKAWVELQVADGSWRTLPTEEFMGDEKPAEQPPVTQQEQSGTTVPPPAPIPPPSTLAEQNDTELQARKGDGEQDASGPLFPAWVRYLAIAVGGPLLLAGLIIGSIVGLKVARRRRRRRAAKVSARVVGGWNDLVDHARDLGRAVPVGAGQTRREQAELVSAGRGPELARVADGHVFGPVEPADVVATAYWSEVDSERREMSRSVNRRQRIRAAVSLRSLRRGRAR
ncbi:transglutaminase-like domain-containing protein [Nocardioides salsibiostraticola]